MRKDISIPEIDTVYLAAIQEYNEAHKSTDWNIILVNTGEEPLEQVLIVSRGEKGEQRTSVLRRQIKLLPAKAFAKAEFIEETVLELNNEFLVTFFLGNIMYEKTFLFPSGTIKAVNAVDLAILNRKGIPAQVKA